MYNVNISKKDAISLEHCLAIAKPDVGPYSVLEIGLHRGETAEEIRNFIRKQLSMKVDYVGIDIKKLKLINLFDELSTILGDSAEVSSKVKNKKFNFIFIDGCNCFNHTILDFFNYEDTLVPGGVIVFHDTAPYSQGQTYQGHGPKEGLAFNVDVRRAVDAILSNNSKYELLLDVFERSNSLLTGGIIAYRKKFGTFPFLASNSRITNCQPEKITIISEWYNEGLLAPLFLNHYHYVDEIRILLEKDTDDNTREICSRYPNVVIQEVHCEDGLNDQAKIDDVNETILKVKDGWIYVLDPDEFIFPDGHEDTQTFLKRQKSDIVMTYNWQVFRHYTDDDIDYDKETLPQRIHGSRDLNYFKGFYIKPSVFKSSAKVALLPGNHKCIGKHSYSDEIYRGAHWNMADLNTAINRRLSQRSRMSETNKRRGYGIQNQNITKEKLEFECMKHSEDPELPILSNVAIGNLKYLLFEINDECQLTNVHKECPRNHDRFQNIKEGEPITVAEIVKFSKEFLRYGFIGFIGFHYYNEPLCSPNKIAEIVEQLPTAKFSLWTNGINLEKNKYLLKRMNDVTITIYPETKKVLNVDSIKKEFSNVKFQMGNLDGRSKEVDESSCKFNPELTECKRVNWDLNIDYYGNIHFCCGDWIREIDLGNIKEDSFLSFYYKFDRFRKWFPKQWDIETYRKLPRVCKICLERSPIISKAR